MELSPINRSKTYELVTGQLKETILDGTFPPGSRLPSVKALADRLGVGQAAIREAMNALRVMHLVEIRHGDGTFVASFDQSDIVKRVKHLEVMSKHDIQALIELRISLETGASRYAALRRSEAQLANLRAILEDMRVGMGQARVGEQADWAFHYEIAKASHNPYMQLLMETIAEQMQNGLKASRLQLYEIAGEEALLITQHQRIYEAIQQGDEDGAAMAMLEHLRHVSSQLFGRESV